MNNPIARNTDPATSHIAAARITDSGKRLTKAQIAAGLVRDYPGSTYTELWSHASMLAFLSPEALMKRLNDARAKGWIRTGSPRRCSVTGNQAATWQAA